jgi:hypothetical protein
LTLSGLSVADSGATFQCVVSSSCFPSSTSDAATLTVMPSPLILGQPASAVQKVGLGAQFSVAATGTLPIGYQWRKNGAPITGATSDTLTINPVTPADVGAYSVIVTDGGGLTASSAAATLVADVTVNVTVTRSGFSYNAGTASYYQTVTIRNNGAQTITGLISLVLDSISIPGALVNLTGTTSSLAAPAGSPYINLTAVSIAPGATANVILQCASPVTYTARVLSGSGQR